MLNWSHGEVHAFVRFAIPPIHLAHITDVAFGKPFFQTEADKVTGRAALLTGKPKERLLVHVIVVIVRNHYGINVRQIGERNTRRHQTFGANKRERRSPLGEMRIRQNIEATGLKQDGGVPDPRGGSLASIGFEPRQIRLTPGDARELVIIRRGRWQALGKALPIPGPRALSGDCAGVIIDETGGRVMWLVALVVAVDGNRRTCHQRCDGCRKKRAQLGFQGIAFGGETALKPAALMRKANGLPLRARFAS